VRGVVLVAQESGRACEERDRPANLSPTNTAPHDQAPPFTVALDPCWAYPTIPIEAKKKVNHLGPLKTLESTVHENASPPCDVNTPRPLCADPHPTLLRPPSPVQNYCTPRPGSDIRSTLNTSATPRPAHTEIIIGTIHSACPCQRAVLVGSPFLANLSRPFCLGRL
jgi:hypothetical protein